MGAIQTNQISKRQHTGFKKFIVHLILVSAVRFHEEVAAGRRVGSEAVVLVVKGLVA